MIADYSYSLELQKTKRALLSLLNLVTISFHVSSFFYSGSNVSDDIPLIISEHIEEFYWLFFPLM